jgi:antitoxin Phd
MKLNTDCMISIEDVKNDFSRLENIINTAGLAVVIKDNKPGYVVLDYNQFIQEQKSADESIEDVAGRITAQNHSDIEKLSQNPENDLMNHTIKLEDILSLNEDYKADDGFDSYNNNAVDNHITEETASRQPDEESKPDGSADIKLNLNSYSNDSLYLDEATKKTIEELKELIRGKD